MSGPVVDDVGVDLLERLLSLCERNPDRTRPASVAPDYDSLPTAQLVRRFEERMLAAERAGAIDVRRGKRERAHLIERIRVKDMEALARHLGRTPAAVIAAQLGASLSLTAEDGEQWVRGVLDEMVNRWSRGEPAFRLSVADAEGARQFILLLAAISKDRARGLDGRTFSLKVAGDTKVFDRHASRIASVLAMRFGDPKILAEQLWKRIGLERYAHPVHLKGCIIAEDNSGVLLDGRAKPFASIHPEMVDLLRLSGKPAALLTIENYASFNRQVREIDDGSLVVYTGGFASPGVVELLSWVLQALDPSVPFYHWGDIDAGGLRIFRFLEESLPRAPLPHLMTRELAEAHGLTTNNDPSLSSIAKSDSAVSDLAAWLAYSPGAHQLEQEALDPCSPLSNVGR